MSGPDEQIRNLFARGDPPARALAFRPRRASAPAPISSRLIAGLGSDAFHGAGGQLLRANRILGKSPGTAGQLLWPNPASWSPQMTQVRGARDSALRIVLGDIGAREPSLQRFTTRFRYEPEEFAPGDTTRARTGGWSNDPSKPPFTRLNDTAFSDVGNLHRTVRHEIWHRIQREHPRVYEPSQPLREFDAHLRDLELRNRLGLSQQERFVSLVQAHDQLRMAKSDPHWQLGLQQVQRDVFTQRFEQQRRDVCYELKDSMFGRMPDYSRICGPPLDPLQQTLHRLFGRGFR